MGRCQSRVKYSANFAKKDSFVNAILIDDLYILVYNIYCKLTFGVAMKDDQNLLINCAYFCLVTAVIALAAVFLVSMVVRAFVTTDDADSDSPC